jgi:hypothetical protein
MVESEYNSPYILRFEALIPFPSKDEEEVFSNEFLDRLLRLTASDDFSEKVNKFLCLWLEDKELLQVINSAQEQRKYCWVRSYIIPT